MSFDGQILIDTNIFLDFYQAKRETIGVLDEMSKFKSRLLFPEQVYREFKRRRLGIIRSQMSLFEGKHDPEMYSNSILEGVEEIKKLASLRKDYRQTARLIASRLEKMLSDPATDPVFKKVEELAEDENVSLIYVDEDDIDRAKNRKMIGNPPNSPDKSTIGDEVIWEGVLSNAKINLVMVTRDNGFHDFASILQDEFHERTKKEFRIVTKFMDAAALVGSPVSAELQKLEKDLADESERNKAAAATLNPWTMGPTGMTGLTGASGIISNYLSMTNQGPPASAPLMYLKTCDCGHNNTSFSKYCGQCGKPIV